MSSVKHESNHLVNERSPYLQQHARNPVDWYPWSKEAFDKALEEDKPVFVSIGYSTCHWCHVMEKESFEDEEVASLLNKKFVSVKVDREERPDIDSIYMKACILMTGVGGWPLTIVMTPQKRPFFAGTYFPRTTREGMIGLIEVLTSIAESWENNRQSLLTLAETSTNYLTEHFRLSEQKETVNKVHLDEGYLALLDSFDDFNGGFGTAPKFPSPTKPHVSPEILRHETYKKLTRHGRKNVTENETGRNIRSPRLRLSPVFHRLKLDSSTL